MIRYNSDCPYCHDVFDQYCNLFKGYKNCDKCDCEVLKILKENEQLKAQNEKMKCCGNCKNLKYYEQALDKYECNIYDVSDISGVCDCDEWGLAE